MNLDLLNNFVNPWEAGGALASQALEIPALASKALETPVLEGNVLEEFSTDSENETDTSFPYIGRINTQGTGFHSKPTKATDAKDYIRPDFNKGDLIYVRGTTQDNWLQVERVTMLGELEEGYVDWRYVDRIAFTDIGYVTEIGHSKKEVGKNTDGSIADDLKYGDMTAQELKDLMLLSLYELEVDSSDELLFSKLLLMSTAFAKGELQTNIFQMIFKFKNREGGYYNSDILNRNVKKHPSTIKFLTEVKKVFYEKLSESKWNPLHLTKHKFIIDADFRPKFNTTDDIFDGLTIAINDTWAFNINLTDYKVSNGKYEATIQVFLYDHFGLDTPDITTTKNGLYGHLEGFRAWFILQHHREKAYKPFITEVTFDYTFSGKLPKQ